MAEKIDTQKSRREAVEPASAGSALADVARDVCLEQGKSHVWYGDPQLCQNIYGRWGGTHTHPLNSIATVISACARSKQWKRTGYISHLGRRYPVYSPNGQSAGTAD